MSFYGNIVLLLRLHVQLSCGVCLRFQGGASPVVWLQLAGACGPHVNILARTKEKMRVQLEQLREMQWQNNCCEI